MNDDEQKERNRQYCKRYREANREKIRKCDRESKRRSRAKDPEKVREYKRNWYKLNPESSKKSRERWKEKNPNYDSIYYDKNAEARRKYIEEYTEKNRDKVNESSRRWIREHQKDPHYRHKFITRSKTYKKYGEGWFCQKCGSDMNIEHHHTTDPYQVDEFIDLCKECHIELHKKERRRNNAKKE